MSHSWQAASSRSHDKAVGLCWVLMGAALDQELMLAREAMMLPVSSSSGEIVSPQERRLSSSGGLSCGDEADSAARLGGAIGGDTHDGGPKSVEYSGCMEISRV